MDISTQPTVEATNQRRMTRPRQGRVLAGVAAAVAEMTGIAVGFVRLVFLVLSLFGGFGLLLYAIGWILLPSSDAADSPAERWFNNLRTPGQRLGAVLIGIAALVLLAPFAPFAVLAAAVLFALGVYLTGSHNTSKE